jgi:hypothetical protein
MAALWFSTLISSSRNATMTTLLALTNLPDFSRAEIPTLFLSTTTFISLHNRVEHFTACLMTEVIKFHQRTIFTTLEHISLALHDLFGQHTKTEPEIRSLTTNCTTLIRTTQTIGYFTLALTK